MWLLMMAGMPDSIAAQPQKLGLLKLRKRLVYARQAKVRVDRGIAVAGKVLAAAENSRIGISAHSLTGKRGDARGVISEAAHPDNGVAAVAVDVQHGRKVEVHAHAAQLARGYRSGGIGIPDAPRRGDGHVARNVHRVWRKARDHAALLVDRDKGRVPGLRDNERLELPAEPAELVVVFNIPSEQYDIADLIFAHERGKILRDARAFKAEGEPLPKQNSVHVLLLPYIPSVDKNCSA